MTNLRLKEKRSGKIGLDMILELRLSTYSIIINSKKQGVF
jgi:hypothetical protein